MPRSRLKISNLNGVKAGNGAVLKVPCGPGAPNLDRILFTLGGGLLPEDITKIKGTINGVIFYDDMGATQILQRDAYYGTFTEDGHFTIDFTNRNARTPGEELITSLPLSLIKDLTFEFEIGPTAPDTCTLKAQMHVRTLDKSGPNQWVRKLLAVPTSFAAGGEQILYLPTGNSGGKITKIYIHESVPGVITDFSIRAGNVVVWESTRADMEYIQKYNNLHPQAGVFIIDLVEDGNIGLGMLDTTGLQNVELRLNASAQAAYRVLYDMNDPIRQV